jgi:hypothetical protein
MSITERSPNEWFQEAVRWYAEHHQGCPWCGGTNCVYHSSRGRVIEYHCGDCDFFACHDPEKKRSFAGAGRLGPAVLTMPAARVLHVD